MRPIFVYLFFLYCLICKFNLVDQNRICNSGALVVIHGGQHSDWWKFFIGIRFIPGFAHQIKKILHAMVEISSVGGLRFYHISSSCDVFSFILWQLFPFLLQIECYVKVIIWNRPSRRNLIGKLKLSFKLPFSLAACKLMAAPIMKMFPVLEEVMLCCKSGKTKLADPILLQKLFNFGFIFWKQRLIKTLLFPCHEVLITLLTLWIFFYHFSYTCLNVLFSNHFDHSVALLFFLISVRNYWVLIYSWILI